MSFEGESEAELHGRVLVQLIRALELGPTAVGGGSAGSRVALLAATHDPEAVSHLLLWWVSGGTVGLLMLGASYCCEPAIAANMGGMAAVAATQLWAAQIRSNSHYRDLLLNQDPDQFIKAMDRWASAFVPSQHSPVTAMSPADFERLTMPVLIFRNSDKDLYHPGWISDWVHKLIPHSKLVAPPWAEDAFIKSMTEAARVGSGHFADWPLLAPAIQDFLTTKK
jgi:pimeloyl-ACP methyl ester carboxylesterase